jgi:hypothetical protein
MVLIFGTSALRCSTESVAINADLVIHHPATSLLLDARHQRLGQLCEICCNVQRPRETERRTAKLEFLNKQREDRDLQEILDGAGADIEPLRR